MKRAAGWSVAVLLLVLASTNAAYADMISGPRVDYIAVDPLSAGMFVGAGLVVLAVAVLAWFALRRMARRREATDVTTEGESDEKAE